MRGLKKHFILHLLFSYIFYNHTQSLKCLTLGFWKDNLNLHQIQFINKSLYWGKGTNSILKYSNNLPSSLIYGIINDCISKIIEYVIVVHNNRLQQLMTIHIHRLSEILFCYIQSNAISRNASLSCLNLRKYLSLLII